MTDGLLQTYKEELNSLQREGEVFAEHYPAVASRLRLDHDGSADPHVERLLQGFAYLAARVRRKIDDEFPEITDALLGVLYPHLLAPIPSASIVQFTLAEDHTGPHVVPRGNVIETDPVNGIACTFRTTAAANLWPVRVESASVGPFEEKLPGYSPPREAQSRLKIRLRTTSKDVTFGGLASLPKNALTSLRFYLHGGGDANLLYEFLLNSVCEGGAVVCVPGGETSTALPDDAIRAAGFTREEAMLPHDARTFPGYRLLMEYFAFPQKFLFIDIGGFTAENLRGAGDCIDLTVFFDRAQTQLEKGVSERTLRLGCAPIVNLFEKTAEEIDLTHRDLAYRVRIDSRRERAVEVYRIEDVVVVSPGREPQQYVPLYGLTHAGSRNGRFWHAARRPSGHPDDGGTEVDLSLIDSPGGDNGFVGGVVRVRALCLNRDWPEELKGKMRLHLNQTGPVNRVESLVQPTPTRRPSLRRANNWKLISHLSLNHLAITGEKDGGAALREILALYDFTGSDTTRARIDAVRATRSSPAMFRVDGRGAFCRGIQVELDLDAGKFADNGAYLFASVLERFLAFSCSINSACRLVVTTSDHRTWNRWPARAGERALL